MATPEVIRSSHLFVFRSLVSYFGPEMNLTAGTAAASGLGDMEVTTTATAAYPCDGASDEEMALYGECAYWLDGIGQVREGATNQGRKRDSQKATGSLRYFCFQILIGCTGFIGNCMAVPVLVSKKLNSIFNRILVFLAVFDNVYILCSVLEGRHSFRMELESTRRNFAKAEECRGPSIPFPHDEC